MSFANRRNVMRSQIHLRLWSVFLLVGLAGFFLLLDPSFALADDHHFSRMSGGEEPLDAEGAVIISFAYAAMFGVCFVGLLLIHAWLAGIAAKLGGLLFIVGIVVPIGLWAFFAIIMVGDAPSSRMVYEPYVLIFGFFWFRFCIITPCAFFWDCSRRASGGKPFGGSIAHCYAPLQFWRLSQDRFFLFCCFWLSALARIGSPGRPTDEEKID